MISATGLALFVVPALGLTCLAPVVLVYFVLRDVKEKTLW